MIRILATALRFALRVLEAPRGQRTAILKRDVTRKVAGAHRYVAGRTPILWTWEAMRFAVMYETATFPRSHRAGQADRYLNRYALGYTTI